MSEHLCCRQCHPSCFPAEALAVAPTGPGHVATRFGQGAGRYLWVEYEGERLPSSARVTEAFAGADGWYLATAAPGGGPPSRVPCPCGAEAAYAEYLVRGAVVLRGTMTEVPHA